MGVKLSKIKKVCMADGQIRLYNVDSPENMILQWLGVDGAMYPVEGVRLTLDMLAVIWEMDAAKIKGMDAVEMDLEDAVNASLVDPMDAECMRITPAWVDMESVPDICMARVFDTQAIKLESGRMTLLADAYCRPCRDGKTDYEIVRKDRLLAAVYTDGKLSGLIRPVSNRTAVMANAMLKSLAARECVGGGDVKGG